MIAFADFLEYFRDKYHEFEAAEDKDIEGIFNEIFCIFPEVRGIIKECTQMTVAGYVVAHYLSLGQNIGGMIMNGSGYTLSSASLGGISVSTNAPPLHDMYESFFGGTVYGTKFLAYLASVGGLNYVN